MSHFLGIAATPGNITDFSGAAIYSEVEAHLSEMLHPYWEQTEVPEYDLECWCVSLKSQEAALEEVKRVLGKTVGEIREEYVRNNPIPEDASVAEMKDILETHHSGLAAALAKSDAIVAEFLRTYKDAKPNPTCEDCGGTGVIKSTYNPASRFDYFVLGGRFRHLLTGQTPERSSIFCLQGNYISAKDAKKAMEDGTFLGGVVPVCVLTPAGEWKEMGKMNAFCYFEEKKSEKAWREEVQNILNETPEDWFWVVVDYHI